MNLDDITPSSSLGFSIFLLAKLKIFANPQCLVVPEKEVKSYAMTLESLESLEEVDHFIFGWRTERVKLKSSRYLDCQKFGLVCFLQLARGNIDIENATLN